MAFIQSRPSMQRPSFSFGDGSSLFEIASQGVARRSSTAAATELPPQVARTRSATATGTERSSEQTGTENGRPSPAIRDAAKLNMLRRMRPPPFQHVWTFYHDRHTEEDGESEQYEVRLTVLLEEISSLKPFWEAFNRFPLDQLRMKDAVHFFKRGVMPTWEDPRNARGGAWIFRVSKAASLETWKEFLLLAVAEAFADVLQPKDDICGLTFSVRYNSNLIQVWNRDGGAQQSIDGIRDVILAGLSPQYRPRVGSYYYKRHAEHTGFKPSESAATATATDTVSVPQQDPTETSLVKEIKAGNDTLETVDVTHAPSEVVEVN